MGCFYNRAARPALHSTRCPARPLLTQGLLTDSGLGAAWCSEGRWPRTMEAPCRCAEAPAPALPAVPMPGGAAGTGTPAPGVPRGLHVLPPGRFVPRAAAQPGPGAKLILQLRAVAQRQGPAAAPRRVPRWPAAVPAPGAPAPWGALRCCSGFYCLNTAKQQQPWCRAAAGSGFVTRNKHGSLLGSISSSCQQSSATAPQAGGQLLRKAQPLPVSDGTARTDAHESRRKAFRHRLRFAF